MKVTEYLEPRDHLVVDGFLSADELESVWSEMMKLGSEFKVGLQSSNAPYRDVKNNRNLIVYPRSKVGNKTNRTCQIITEKLREKTLHETFEKSRSPIYRFLKHCRFPNFHLSSYHDGEYYGRHIDKNEPVNLTIVLFLCKEPKKFSGGDFILSFRDEKKTIGFKNNRLLIFPSNTRHEVTRVALKGGRFEDGRFTIQVWPHLKMSSQYSAAYSAKQKKSYYTPRFAVGKNLWRDLEKLASRKSPKGEKANGGVIEQIMAQLSANLKYVGRAALAGNKLLVAMAVNETVNQERRLVVVSSTIRKHSSTTSFGYYITQSAGKPLLHFFFKTRSRSRIVREESKLISPQANYRRTMRTLTLLIAKAQKRDQSQPVSAKQLKTLLSA